MENFRLNFIHLCDEATFSKEGKLSLIGIFDIVNLVTIPGSLLKAILVCNFTVLNASFNEVAIDIAITRRGDTEPTVKLPTIKAEIPTKPTKMEKDETKIGLTVQLGNLNFKSEGPYSIEVKANETLLGTYKFTVKQLENKLENKKTVN